MTCVINDIDGDTAHTIDSGPLDEVIARADDAHRDLIRRAEQDGEAEAQIVRDGEAYTVRAVVTRVDRTIVG